jgi:hypothetical protein
VDCFGLAGLAMTSLGPAGLAMTSLGPAGLAMTVEGRVAQGLSRPPSLRLRADAKQEAIHAGGAQAVDCFGPAGLAMTWRVAWRKT